MIIKLEVFDIGLLPGPPENPRVLLPYDRSRVVASPYEFRDFQKTYFATMGASVGVWVVDTQAYGPVSTSEHVSRHDDGNLRILGIPVVVREVPEIFRGYTYAELLQHASPTVRLWAVANLGALVAPRRQPEGRLVNVRTFLGGGWVHIVCRVRDPTQPAPRRKRVR